MRRDPSSIPNGYLDVADNVIANDGSMQSRTGLVTHISDILWEGIDMARPIDIADNTKWFVLAHDTGIGVYKLYYCVAGVNTVIVNPVPTGTLDFHFVRVYNTYIITFDDGQNGIAAANSYVFNPAIHSVARISGKTAPASAITVTVAGGAATKNIEPGVHVWGVCFETDTGHFSQVILAGLVSAVHPTPAQAADLSNIPVGGAGTGTVKRHILVSKVIPNFDGNLVNYELFFIPGALGVLNDNTTTVLANVEFYDSELVDSADYLKDISASSASYSSVCQYAERFVGCGKPAAGTGNNSPHVADVSNAGLPESLDTTAGFITVDPGYGTALQHCVEWKGYLVLIKDIGTYMAKDNGDLPNTWPVDKIDASYGCGPQGVCRVYAGQPGVIQDALLILTTSGLKIFMGSYAEESLTKLIDGYFEDLVSSVTYASFRTWQVYADPINKYIYILARVNGSVVVLVGDYRNGMTPNSMVWTKFKFAYDGTQNSYVSCIATIPYTSNGGGGGIMVGGRTSAIYKLNTTGNYADVTILPNWELTTSEFSFSDQLTKDQYVSCRVLIKAPTNNAVAVSVYIGDMTPLYPIYQSVNLPNPLATGVPQDVLQFSINQQAIKGHFSIKSVASTDPNIRAYLDYIKQVLIYGKKRELLKPL